MRALATHPAARGLEDDAAVLEVGDETLILTHDAMVEGTHFLPEQDPADIAWKLVATNLSDLAAKGAEPVGILLSHTLSADDSRFVEGLTEVLGKYDCLLLGGDTVSGAEQRTYGATAIGRATHCPVPARSGARPRDGVYLTGPVGAAMLGFEALRDDTGQNASAYLRPIPLLTEGQALAPLVSAMMDVSDGLLLDASRIAKASGVTINIDSTSVPIATQENRRNEALRWGDDYQLLFTVNQDVTLPVEAIQVGKVTAANTGTLLINGQPPASDDSLGYSH